MRRKALLIFTAVILISSMTLLGLPVIAALAGAALTNGTGVASGSPVALSLGANTITVSQVGTFTIVLPVNYEGTAATSSTTVSDSPKALVAGSNTITTTGEAGEITVTVAHTYPAMAGVYNCKGVITEFQLDGTRHSIDRTINITLTTQGADGAISAADIYLAGESSPTWAVTGFVGSDPRPRMVLYADSGEGSGYPVVVNCFIKLNRDGSVKYIQGTIDGLLDADTDLQISGSFKGNFAALPET